MLASIDCGDIGVAPRLTWKCDRAYRHGDFYRQEPSGGKRVLPPLRLDTALNNPDSIAYAAVVLADNGGAYPEEL